MSHPWINPGMGQNIRIPSMKNKKEKRKVSKFSLFCYIGLFPTMFIYFLFRVIPILETIRISFYKWSIVGMNNRFIGFDNFYKLFKDKLFITSFINTTIFTILVVSFSFIFSLSLAIMINNRRIEHFSAVYNLIYILPVITPMVPVALMWKWIYDPQYGLLNHLLSFFGITPKAWLVQSDLALYAIAVLSIWKIVGYYTVIFLVGLKNIPKEYYDAASIDGAAGWGEFRYITLPLLRPISLYVLVIAIIQAYNVFTQVFVMTSDIHGSPGRLVRTIVYDIYENGLRHFKMGYAAAESIILLLIVFLATIMVFRILGREK